MIGDTTNSKSTTHEAHTGDVGGLETERTGGGRSYSRGGSELGQGLQSEKQKAGPMEVVVEQNIEKAMKILKRKLIKEGLFKELKSRRYYEKPSEKRKRKTKESRKKLRKEEARLRKGSGLAF